MYQQEQCTNKNSISTMYISMISRTLKRSTSLLFRPVRTAVSMRVRLRTRSASVTRIPTGESRSRMTRNNVCFIGTSLPEAFRRPDCHHRETPGFSMAPTTPSFSTRTSLLTAKPAFMAVAGGSLCTGTFAAVAVFWGPSSLATEELRRWS